MQHLPAPIHHARDAAQLPVAIDYPAALALRQMSMVHDELPKYLLYRHRNGHIQAEWL
ncbi:hypothetical protein GII95_21425 [Escherichia coli]|nr:hypothetical protein [Escherichia coli]